MPDINYIDYDCLEGIIFGCDFGPSFPVTYRFKYTPPEKAGEGFPAGSLELVEIIPPPSDCECPVT